MLDIFDIFCNYCNSASEIILEGDVSMGYLSEALKQYGFNELEQQNLIAAFDKVMDIHELEEVHKPEDSLNKLNDLLQNNFIRPKGSERQQLEDKFKDLKLREELLALLKPFTEAITTGSNYPNKLLLGATQQGIKFRLDTLIHSIHNGTDNTKVIYPLAGERNLWPNAESYTLEFVAERIYQIEKGNISTIKTEIQNQFDLMLKDEQNITKAHQNIVKYYTDKGIKWPTETDLMNKLIEDYKNQYHKELNNIEFKPAINAKKKFDKEGNE